MGSYTTDLGLCAVTGGHGWLGFYLVSYLVKNNYKVRILDVLEKPSVDISIISYFDDMDYSLTEYYKCDITKKEDLRRALKGVNTVFHVCAITDVRPCPVPIMYSVNVDGTQNVMDVCQEHNIQTLVYSGSVSVVDDEKPKCQSDENEPLFFDGYMYSRTKALAEQIVLNSARGNQNIAVGVIRISRLYGPGCLMFLAPSVYPFSLTDEKAKQSFNDVVNTCYAHVECAKALTSSKTREQINGQVFNIKDVDENFDYIRANIMFDNHGKLIHVIPFIAVYLVAWISDIIALILFKLFSIRYGPAMTNFGVTAVRNILFEYTVNVDKFQKMIGYNPPQSIEQSYEETRKWYKLYKQKYYSKKISSS